MKKLHKKLVISSLQNNIWRVEQFVEEICDENYISPNYFGTIMLAMEEAVKNAIVHGNNQDHRKNVTITFQRKRNGLMFLIEDEGNGFDHRKIPSPIDTEDALGNGIFLMRSLADEVRFNDKGNQVELVFSTSGINPETTLNRISQLKKYFSRQKSIV